MEVIDLLSSPPANTSSRANLVDPPVTNQPFAFACDSPILLNSDDDEYHDGEDIGPSPAKRARLEEDDINEIEAFLYEDPDAAYDLPELVEHVRQRPARRRRREEDDINEIEAILDNDPDAALDMPDVLDAVRCGRPYEPTSLVLSGERSTGLVRVTEEEEEDDDENLPSEDTIASLPDDIFQAAQSMKQRNDDLLERASALLGGPSSQPEPAPRRGMSTRESLGGLRRAHTFAGGEWSDEEDLFAASQPKAKRRAPDTAKREQREAARAEKAREKEEEKERKRQAREEKAKEKRVAAEIAEVNKARVDKKETTAEMIVYLPASFQGETIDSQTRQFLHNLSVEMATYASSVPHVVKWRRKKKARWHEEAQRWEPLHAVQVADEHHFLCWMSAKDFATRAMTPDGDESLSAHVEAAKRAYSGCTPIYMIEGLHALYRRNQNAQNRAYQAQVLHPDGQEANNEPAPARRRNRAAPVLIDEETVEDALLQLQVTHECLIQHTNTALESAEHIAAFTQHLSTLPYKRQQHREDAANFCMEKSLVHTGKTPADTFYKLLQEIVRVTPGVAKGIIKEFPDVLSLSDALKREGPSLLEDIRPLGSGGRIGPSISRRMHGVFTGLDPASTNV